MSVRRLLAVLSTTALVVVGPLVTAADASAFPPGTTATATINATVFDVGDKVSVTVMHTAPRGVLTMTLTGPDVVLKSGVVVPRSGTATIAGRIPDGYSGSHTVRVESEGGGEIFPFAVTITGPPDSTPPGPVTGLAATTAGSSATLTWTAPTDPDFTGVEIFRATGTTPPPYGTGPVGGSDPGVRSFTDGNLDGRTTYSWSVFTHDAAGNISPAATVSATTARTTNVLAWGAPAVVDPFRGRPGSVSCPSAALCLAGDGEGNIARWDGSSWGAPQHLFEVPGLSTRVAVSCASTTWCVAVDDTYGDSRFFDGTGWTQKPSLSFRPFAVSCPSTTFCLAVGDAGRWATFDGATWTDGPNPVGPALRTVSCAGAARCVALDENAHAWRFDGSTFAALPAGSSGAFDAVTCAPGSTTCLGAATDGSSQILRAANTWTSPTPIAGGRLDALSCVRASLCVGARSGAVVATFDGSTWTASDPGATPTGWQGTQPADAISCVSRTFCATAGYGWFRGFQGTGLPYTVGYEDRLQGGVSDVSCVADGFCLMVDQLQNWSTHDPGGTWTAPKLDLQLLTRPVLSCVSRTWCLAVRADGAATRWNGTGFQPFAPVPLTDIPYLTDVSCSSTTSCVAVGFSGGIAIWDGTTWASQHLDGASNLRSVSCRARTCVTVDIEGHAFVLTLGTGSTVTTLNGGTPLVAVSCGTNRYCLASDQDGRLAEWNGTTWTAVAGPAGLQPTSLSCTGVRACTASESGRVATLSTRGWSTTTTLDPAGGVAHLSCWSATGCTLFSREGTAVTTG